MSKSVLFLGLRLDSWQNLFDVIRSEKTELDTRGNFWAAVQHLERQLPEELKLPEELRKEAPE